MNHGKAVVYPLAGSKKLSHPQIFRKPDGTFGMIAADNNNQGFIVYDSPDLIEYLDETFIPAQFGGSTVENLTCKYDNALKGFVISWATSDGKNYTAVTSDLKNLNEVKEVSGNTFEVVTATIPEGAKDVS